MKLLKSEYEKKYVYTTQRCMDGGDILAETDNFLAKRFLHTKYVLYDDYSIEKEIVVHDRVKQRILFNDPFRNSSFDEYFKNNSIDNRKFTDFMRLFLFMKYLHSRDYSVLIKSWDAEDQIMKFENLNQFLVYIKGSQHLLFPNFSTSLVDLCLEERTNRYILRMRQKRL